MKLTHYRFMWLCRMWCVLFEVLRLSVWGAESWWEAVVRGKVRHS
jgi:hypothetical protein